MACYGCSRPIPDGEPYVSVDYHIERTDEGMVIVDQPAFRVIRLV